MVGVSAELRDYVRSRAGGRCEYCGLLQAASPFFRFQIEHIIARQHGGVTDEANLALACVHCNLHKGPNLAGLDPTTSLLTPLYNPRSQRWSGHFEQVGAYIVGLSAVGRATTRVLNMNAPNRLELRSLIG